MNGINIKFRQESFLISKEFNANVFLYHRFGNYYVEISGLDNNISHKWLDTRMKMGEPVEIEFVEMDLDKSSQPIKIDIAFSDSLPLNAHETKEMYNEERSE